MSSVMCLQSLAHTRRLCRHGAWIWACKHIARTHMEPPMLPSLGHGDSSWVRRSVVHACWTLNTSAFKLILHNNPISGISSTSTPLGSSRTRSRARDAAAPRRPPGNGARAALYDVRRCRHRTAVIRNGGG
eukprot:1031906-Pleurochrysis_carterae.AAC.1